MFNQTARLPALRVNPLRFLEAFSVAFQTRVDSLPLRPQRFPMLLETFATGISSAFEQPEAQDVLEQIRLELFDVPARASEAYAAWSEAVVTAAFAARIAQLKNADVAVAVCGALLHRSGEALASQAVALAEADSNVLLDAPSRKRFCSEYGPALTERLLREWHLSPEVGACISGWRRFGEFETPSTEASAVYFAHVLAADALHPEFIVPGALEALAVELNLTAEQFVSIRDERENAFRLIRGE